jgi:signal transduction histidine kinase
VISSFLHLPRPAAARFFDYLLERPLPLVGGAAVVLALTVILIDATTWVELNVTTVYGLPLVIAALARNRRLLWSLAACLIVALFGEPYFINGVLSALALVLSAALCDVWIVAASRLAAQRRALVEQNRELDRLRLLAEEASARKTQLLASVSHDIRTPLTAIDLIGDLVLHSADNAELAAQLPDLAQRLRRNTLSLRELVGALVDISALDSGRIAVRNGDFSLNALIEEEQQHFVPLAKAKGLRLVLEPPHPPLWLHADRGKLRRVLSNLLGNAVKFTEAGCITLSATLAPGREALLRVRDTGIGMTAHDLERIFDEYGQLGHPQRDGNQGWGLGLAICRRLVGVMGGTITVESERHRGTTFTVRLPASCVLRRQ